MLPANRLAPSGLECAIDAQIAGLEQVRDLLSARQNIARVTPKGSKRHQISGTIKRPDGD
jgi:hypothetical protein